MEKTKCKKCGNIVYIDDHSCILDKVGSIKLFGEKAMTLILHKCKNKKE